MEVFKTIIIVLILILFAFYIRHIHYDISAIQIKLEMLDEQGKILPEFKHYWM